MPWSLSQREGKWCVVKDSDGEVEGCHSSRTDAIKQQRALYANESRVAAMYAELDAISDPVEEIVDIQPERSSLSPFATELVGMLLKEEREKSLTASLAKSMDAISERMTAEKEERGALVAALSQIGQPVINVASPDVQVDVNVPTPEITVEPAQITIQPPDVKVEVKAPNVTINPEIVLPSDKKTVTFQRDPFGQITGAHIKEEVDGGL